MLKLTAKKYVGHDINAAVVMLLNGNRIGMVAPLKEHADELVGLLNGAVDMREALCSLAQGIYECDLHDVILGHVMLEIPSKVWEAACAIKFKAEGGAG